MSLKFGVGCVKNSLLSAGPDLDALAEKAVHDAHARRRHQQVAFRASAKD